MEEEVVDESKDNDFAWEEIEEPKSRREKRQDRKNKKRNNKITRDWLKLREFSHGSATIVWSHFFKQKICTFVVTR